MGYLDEGEDDDVTNHDRQYARGLESVPYPKQRPKADPKPLVEYLQRLFPPLVFPDTVATQMLSHISAKEAWAGHNARLAFVGTFVTYSCACLVGLSDDSWFDINFFASGNCDNEIIVITFTRSTRS